MIPVPNETYRLAICNKATASKIKKLTIKGKKGIFFRYTFTRSATSISLTIPEADAERYNIPQEGYAPDFLVASQTAYLLAYFLTRAGWNKKGEAVTIKTTVTEIATIVHSSKAPTEREKRTTIARIKDGLNTLRWVDFKNQEAACHGYGGWEENSRGVITIQLTADYTRLLIKTHKEPFFPQLLALKSRDELAYKLAQILHWRAPERCALSIKTLAKWLAIPLDTTPQALWKQRARLELALDTLTHLQIITKWKYTITKNNKTTEVPRGLNKLPEWVNSTLRWQQQETEATE